MNAFLVWDQLWPGSTEMVEAATALEAATAFAREAYRCVTPEMWSKALLPPQVFVRDMGKGETKVFRVTVERWESILRLEDAGT